MKVYILSTYEEHGATDVVATLDPEQLPALLLSLVKKLGWKDDMVPELAKMQAHVAEGSPIDGTDLTEGWGGIQLHIVELQ